MKKNIYILTSVFFAMTLSLISCSESIESVNGTDDVARSAQTTQASPLTKCIINNRQDILPFYRGNGWDVSESNWDNIINNWCGIDPFGCAKEKEKCQSNGGASQCSKCITDSRQDIIPFYRRNGWDVSESNWNNIINDWCSIDPAGCAKVKRNCASVCDAPPYRYIIYTPVSGIQKGQLTYCDGSQHHHSIDNLCCPNDIETRAYTHVRLYCSSTIKSIRTIRTGPDGSNGNNGDKLCDGTFKYIQWVDEGVKVELYSKVNARDYIGTVFYGHLKNRIQNGIYNNPNKKFIGQIGIYVSSCSCYEFVHVHMARSANGSTQARKCYAAVKLGDPVYYFD